MTKLDIARELYSQIKDISGEESLELVLLAEDKDEQDFFSVMGDFFLQKNQREVIEQKRF
jgi:hypothetical protein